MNCDMKKVQSISGYKVTGLTLTEGRSRGAITVPGVSEEGVAFDRLVGYMYSNGTWAWVHKNFRK